MLHSLVEAIHDCHYLCKWLCEFVYHLWNLDPSHGQWSSFEIIPKSIIQRFLYSIYCYWYWFSSYATWTYNILNFAWSLFPPKFLFNFLILFSLQVILVIICCNTMPCHLLNIIFSLVAKPFWEQLDAYSPSCLKSHIHLHSPCLCIHLPYLHFT